MGGCCVSLNVDPEYVANILVEMIKDGLDVTNQHGSSIAHDIERRLARILWPTKELQAVSPKVRRASSLGTLTPNRSNDHLEINPRRSRPSSSASQASRQDFSIGAFTPSLTAAGPAAGASASGVVGSGDGGDSLSAMDLNPTSPTRVTAAPTPAAGIAPQGPIPAAAGAHELLNVTPDWDSVHAVLNTLIGTTSDLHETVLHYAVRRNVTEVVRVLLMFTPDILKLNDRGNSILHLACIAGCKEEIVAVILQYSWSNSASLLQSHDIEVRANVANLGNLDESQLPPLLRRSSSANSEQRFVTDERLREQLLLELPDKQSVSCPPETRRKIVQKLINMKNDDGDSALHLATRNRFGWLVRALLAHGADRDAKNREGDTALDIIRLQNGGLAQNPLSRNLFVRKKKSAPGPWWREDLMTEQYLLSLLDPDYKEELWY